MSPQPQAAYPRAQASFVDGHESTAAVHVHEAKRTYKSLTLLCLCWIQLESGRFLGFINVVR